jgi:hypothetical protein
MRMSEIVCRATDEFHATRVTSITIGLIEFVFPSPDVAARFVAWADSHKLGTTHTLSSRNVKVWY